MDANEKVFYYLFHNKIKEGASHSGCPSLPFGEHSGCGDVVVVDGMERTNTGNVWGEGGRGWSLLKCWEQCKLEKE